MTLSATALSAFAIANASASAAQLTNGTVDLLDSGGSVLASAGLGTPGASGATVTMGGFPKTVSAAAGIIVSARYRTSGGADWKTGMSVGLAGSGAQVIVSALTIGAGQTVTVNSATLVHSLTSA